MILSVFILSVILSVDATTLTRVEVPEAKCIDGSPYSYYVSKGSEPTKFYVYHQGGGWCTDLKACEERANTPLGSSKTWGSTLSYGDGMSRDASVNPLMNQWTFVYLPYCDGGSFTGDAVTSNPVLNFQGLKIREAVAESIRTNYGFDHTATDLVIGGCSAGGLATYLHADWWASHVPNAKARALPDSGFFLDGNYSRDNLPDYEARMKNLYTMMNSKTGIPYPCQITIGYKCLFAYHVMPYIRTPILALNSLYDATMKDGQCGYSGIVFNWNNASSVNACGEYIASIFKKEAKPPSAAFLDSCTHHCGNWGTITIDNVKSPKALELWYNGGTGALPNGGFMVQGKPFPCAACCSS